MRRSSVSANEIVEKLQHVSVCAWFFTGVVSMSFRGVNLKPSAFKFVLSLDFVEVNSIK